MLMVHIFAHTPPPSSAFPPVFLLYKGEPTLILRLCAYFFRLIAKEMAKLHTMKPKHISSKKCAMFDKLREWLDIIPDSFSDPQMNDRYVSASTHPT